MNALLPAMKTLPIKVTGAPCVVIRYHLILIHHIHHHRFHIRCFTTCCMMTNKSFFFAAVFLFGTGGTGKSRLARKAAKSSGKTPFVFTPDSEFWYNYNGEKFVIFEEFVGRIPCSVVKAWLDQYPTAVRVMYAERQLLTTHSILCSNVAPWELYSGVSQGSRMAFLRRFKIFEVSRSHDQDGKDVTWVMPKDPVGNDLAPMKRDSDYYLTPDTIVELFN